MRILNLILLIVVLLFSNCKHSNNIRYKYYDTGEVKEKIVPDGEELGKFQVFLYSKKGNLLKELNSRNGVYHGVCRDYFDNGNVKAKANFFNGLKNGKFYTFYDNGNIKFSRTFLNDTANGVTTAYFEDGTVDEEFLYIAGESIVYKMSYTSIDSLYINIQNFERNEKNDFYKNGHLISNTLNNLLEKEMSLYYIIRSEKDTIKINESLDLELEVVNKHTWKTRFVSKDGKIECTGDNNIIRFKVVPEKKGYNLFLGKLFIDSDTLKEDTHYEFTVYKEFYVEPL